MKLCLIRFDDLPEFTDETKAMMRAAIIYPDIDPFSDEGPLRWYAEYVADIHKMPPVPFRVIKHIGAALADAPLGLDVDSANRSPAFNQKVQVIVPGLGLLLIDEVSIACDACTSELNSALKDGWRILAVCPQPDQRRPDYVLGRSTTFNKEA